MHVLFGSVTGFDFSFGNYRSITKIGCLYFFLSMGHLSVFIFPYIESYLEERGDVF